MVPVSTHSTPANIDLNCNKGDEGNNRRAGNERNTTTEVTVNVVMDDEIVKNKNTEVVNSNGVNNVICDSNCNKDDEGNNRRASNKGNTTTEVTVNVVMDDEMVNNKNTEVVNSNGVNNVISDSNAIGIGKHAALEAHETPAKAGITVDGLDEVNGDDMDCEVVPVSQASVVDEGGIIEVLETGFSGSSVMDTDARTEAALSQAESLCSTNDAQILPFSQEEASQGILAPVESLPEVPSPPRPKRRERSSRRQPGRHDLPLVVPDVPSRHSR